MTVFLHLLEFQLFLLTLLIFNIFHLSTDTPETFQVDYSASEHITKVYMVYQLLNNVTDRNRKKNKWPFICYSWLVHSPFRRLPARSAAGPSQLSASISQLNKDDRTAFLFLYFFFLLPDYSNFFLDTTTDIILRYHFYSGYLLKQRRQSSVSVFILFSFTRTIPNVFLDTIFEHFTSVPLIFRIPTKMYLFYYFFWIFSGFLTRQLPTLLRSTKVLTWFFT